MNDFQGLFDIRDYKESDKSFVMATFLRGLYYGDFFFEEIPKDVFMNNYKVVADRLLSSPKVTIKVACLPDDSDVILGYSILSADFMTVHWVFVKSVWRKRGIMTALVPQYPTAVTHLTKVGKLLLKDKFKTAVFNPFLIG